MSANVNPSRPDPKKIERFVDLMTQQAVGGLSEDENLELENLVGALELTPQEVEREKQRLELTAASVDMALAENTSSPLPRGLRDKVLLQAGENFSQKDRAIEDPVSEPSVVRKPVSSSLPNWREVVSILAAAACLFVLVGNWQRIFPAPAPTVAQLQAEFLQSNPVDLVKVDWKPGPDDTGTEVSGNVVWSKREQQGFMTFKNLKINDPAAEQYQLWIFESADQKYPVDGGVFDITDDEVAVSINAKIAVENSVLFAITVEKPGGVVVSDRSRIAALASVE